MKSIRILRPDQYYSRAMDIDFDLFKKIGISLVLIDFDNTLSPQGSTVLDEYGASVIEKIRNADLECMFFSNAKSKRIADISAKCGVKNVRRPLKPFGKRIKQMISSRDDLTADNIVVIGDQIFTDIAAGNLAGVKTVLVDPISSVEPLQIRIKRQLEKPFKKRMTID